MQISYFCIKQYIQKLTISVTIIVCVTPGLNAANKGRKFDNQQKSTKWPSENPMFKSDVKYIGLDHQFFLNDYSIMMLGPSKDNLKKISRGNEYLNKKFRQDHTVKSYDRTTRRHSYIRDDEMVGYYGTLVKQNPQYKNANTNTQSFPQYKNANTNTQSFPQYKNANTNTQGFPQYKNANTTTRVYSAWPQMKKASPTNQKVEIRVSPILSKEKIIRRFWKENKASTSYFYAYTVA